MSSLPNPAQAAIADQPAPPDPERAARNAANARNRRRNAFVKRAIELGHFKTNGEALAAFDEAEIAREAYIASMMAQHPEWDRARAASGWLPHGVVLRSTPHQCAHHVTQDDGWVIDRKSWAFQRTLWRDHQIVLAFGEYRRLIKQASIMTGTVAERRANYRRRVATVTLDNGQSIDIDIVGDRIFGMADASRPRGDSTDQSLLLSKTLREKYNLALEPGTVEAIERQVRAMRGAPAVMLPGRAIYRVEVGGNPEVYVMVRKGRVLEAKRAAGVRKALAKQPEPAKPPPQTVQTIRAEEHA